MESQLAVSSDLGQLISAHRVTFGSKWGNLIFGIVLIVLGPVIYLGLTNLWANSGAGMAEVLKTTPFLQYLPIGLGIIAVLLGLLTLIKALRNWSLAVRVYENGFEHTDRRGTKKVLWADIEGFRQQIIRYYRYAVIPAGSSYWLNIQTRQGENFTLDNRFSKIKKLAETLQQRLASVQLPKYLAELEAGQRVAFGPLGLDRQGVYQYDKSLSWSEVGKVEFDNGQVVIKKKGSNWGNWAKLDVSLVPNAAVFVMLAQKFQSAA
ncbi:MAG TPA: DUF6585 family protein [Aggregatilineaceae bacterium]|nr:DUF6585 family protein [Aggregatilineaceae bacterium]